jgi:ribosomal protein S10
MLYNFKLKIVSINSRVLFLYKVFIINILKKNFLKFNFINLPKKKKLLTLLKSSHVYKKAQEHYQLITYSNLLVIKNININIIKFIFLNKPKTLKLILKKYETNNS